MSDDMSALANFGGTARLFPLPNVVLFPQVVQPLHIFEPRYRQMTAEALDTDRLIALALLKPGWEAEYTGQPSIHTVACLGRIVAEQRLEDGRFNILLRGLSRIRIVEELATDKLYRTARIEMLHDGGFPAADRDEQLRGMLAPVVWKWLDDQGAVLEQLRKLLKSDQPLSVVTDIIAFALPMDPQFKQHLLSILNVEERARSLGNYLADEKPPVPAATPARKYPLEFSTN
jgi:Lon protease-like protein